MDFDIARAKELIHKRDEIDAELADIFAVAPRGTASRKPQACSHCGEAGHSARTCPKKQSETPQQ